MREEIKAKWVAALRSGEYKQGIGRLRYDTDDGTSYCCLGVLCDLAEKEGITRLHLGEEESYAHYDDDADLLPPSVMRWAGLDDSDTEIRGYELTYYNDESQFSFNEIADLIEENL